MNNPQIDADGTKRWYNEEKQLHRLDGPAIELANGTKHWYQNGKCHRLDGAAIQYADGTYEFWEYGKKLTNPTIYDEFKPSMVTYE